MQIRRQRTFRGTTAATARQEPHTRPSSPARPALQHSREGDEDSQRLRCIGFPAFAGNDSGVERPYCLAAGAIIIAPPFFDGAGGGLVATACAGKYFATMAGSTWAMLASGSRVQVSSLPNREMPRKPRMVSVW